MNRGLLLKTFRESWVVVVTLALAIGVAEGLLAYVLPTIFSEYSEQILQFKFFQRIIAGLLGTELGSPLTEDMIRLFAWVHPVILSLLWVQAVWSGTRLPAAEIDRGTIDFLLCLPASRWSIYISDSVVTLATGVLMVGSALAGNAVATALGRPASQSGFPATLAIAANFYCVYLAVAGLAYFLSAMSDRRGRAVAAVVGILLASFLWNFLAQFWEPAKFVDALSIMHYYRPMQVAGRGTWPVGDMLVLAGAGLALWLAGAAVFIRRDLRTL